jgi:Fur family transcriptional regulator, ferric uptake regulator
MSVFHEARPVPAVSVPATVTSLRAQGMRVSAARRQVIEALFAAEGPATAEELASGADLASVYRNLDTLEQMGLVRHFHVGHGPGLYALTDRHRHGYAACEHCGAHSELPADVLARVTAAIREAVGYETRLSHFPIVGRCPDCAA